MAFFSYRGRAISYRLLGDADRPLLVLAHPLGMTQGVWDDLIPGLLDDFRLLTWDLAGHGASQACDAGQSAVAPADLANEIIALSDLAHTERFHFVGTSIGGAVGQQLLVEHPSRLRSLTLTNTGALIGSPEAWQERARRVRHEGLAAMAAEIVARWFSPAALEHNPALSAGWQVQLGRSDNHSYALFCEMLGKTDFRGRLPKRPAHVTLVGGSADPAIPPATLNALAGELGGLPVKILDGAGHVPSIEQPGVFLNLIRAAAGR